MPSAAASPGELADVAVLSGDPLAVAPETIRDIAVEATAVGGEVVWSAER